VEGTAGPPELWITLVGIIVVSAGLISALFRCLELPSLVGYIFLGILLGAADQHFGFINPSVRHALAFLADIGIVALLFRVGLESNAAGLMKQLPKASFVWLVSMVTAALLGFVTSYYLLELALIPSLVAAAALTATSVGVSIAPWQDAGSLDSEDGRLLLDVAEMDDISGVVLMGLLLAVLPVIQGQGGQIWGRVAESALSFAVKFGVFTIACVLFARFLEQRLIGLSAKIEPGSSLMLTVLGIGFVIAAVAGWLGFSLAVGALFAGLVFSRDPKAVHTEANFNDLYAFFTPFFFIGIGMAMETGAIGSALSVGLVLLGAAVIGKLVGVMLPALPFLGTSGSVLIAVSMVPRAEIAMLIMHQGKRFGESVVPEALYGGMVLVSMVTCIAAPIILRPLLNRRR